MKQVSIVGKSDGYTDVYNAEGAVWAVSSVFKRLRASTKVDLIFNIHKPILWEPWLPEEAGRVIVPEGFHGNYKKLGCKRLLDKYGAVFGSSIAWMMAYAIEEGFQKISVLGVDMATRTEYADQRDTFFYWCGRAEAAGINVYIPSNRRIYFKDRIYGVL